MSLVRKSFRRVIFGRPGVIGGFRCLYLSVLKHDQAEWTAKCMPSTTGRNTIPRGRRKSIAKESMPVAVEIQNAQCANKKTSPKSERHEEA